MINYITNIKPIFGNAIITSGFVANILSWLSLLNPVLGFIGGVVALFILIYKLKSAIIESKIKEERLDNLKKKHHNH